MGDFLSENPLVLLIGACEVGFWVLLGAGLVARYLLRARRVSTVLLVLVPVLDVVLVTASLVDVAAGSPPALTHGLAAVYLGFTVAFGHTMIRWVDRRVRAPVRRWPAAAEAAAVRRREGGLRMAGVGQAPAGLGDRARRDDGDGHGGRHRDPRAGRLVRRSDVELGRPAGSRRRDLVRRLAAVEHDRPAEGARGRP
jgi:hypothetical protein